MNRIELPHSSTCLHARMRRVLFECVTHTKQITNHTTKERLNSFMMYFMNVNSLKFGLANVAVAAYLTVYWPK